MGGETEERETHKNIGLLTYLSKKWRVERQLPKNLEKSEVETSVVKVFSYNYPATKATN